MLTKQWQTNVTTYTNISSGFGGRVLPAGSLNDKGDVVDTVVDHHHSFSTVKFPSYEFRVVEWTDDKDNIVKVGLQYREFLHNSSTGDTDVYEPFWSDVPRIRLRQY